jgi:hypothetical protein
MQKRRGSEKTALTSLLVVLAALEKLLPSGSQNGELEVLYSWPDRILQLLPMKSGFVNSTPWDAWSRVSQEVSRMLQQWGKWWKMRLNQSLVSCT